VFSGVLAREGGEGSGSSRHTAGIRRGSTCVVRPSDGAWPRNGGELQIDGSRRTPGTRTPDESGVLAERRAGRVGLL